MAVAVVRGAARWTALALAAAAGLGVGPTSPVPMLTAIDRALTAMAFAAAGLAVFAVVWAGFILMAEGAEERGGGRARGAVLGALAGLALVLSAKAVALVLTRVVFPIQ